MRPLSIRPHRRLTALIALVALLAAACHHTPGEPHPTSSSATSTSSEPSSTTTSSTSTTTQEPSETLYLFYSVHVHGPQDYMPYTSEEMTEIDSEEAAGLRSHVLAIAETLEAHGAKGSFHFVYGASQGLCTEYRDLIPRLLDAGHEIGVHAHRNEDVDRAVASLEQYCGVTPVTGSGLMAMANTQPSPHPGNIVVTDASLAESMSELAGAGVEQILGNLAQSCGHPTGVPEGTGNLLYPWQPAYLGDEPGPCEDDPGGFLVNIDHASIHEYNDGTGQADVLGEEQFDHLQQLFETALSLREEDEPVAAWGFVTHTHEYIEGTDIATPPDEDAVAALDAFLSALDQYVSDGLAVWSTGEEIADHYRSSR